MDTTDNQVVSEINAFLSSKPTPERISAFKVSRRSQNRFRRLLMRNQSGLLTAEEKIELDEVEALEHSMTMLKVQALEDLARRRV